ncbi:MAG: prolyl oligopeptidase family serine peptidase [Agarilytica sp.]
MFGCKFFGRFVLSVSFVFCFCGEACSDIKIEKVKQNFESEKENEIKNIPGDEIYRWDEMSLPVLSSNGKYVAFRKKVKGYNYLLISDIDKGRVIQHFNVGKSKINTLKWKGGRVIAEVNRQIFEFSIGDGQPRHVLGPNDEKKSWSSRSQLRWRLLSATPKDADSIVVYGYDSGFSTKKVYRYNIFTDEAELLHDQKKGPKGARWYYDKSGDLRVIVHKVKGGVDFYTLYNGKPRIAKRFKFDNISPVLDSGKTVLSQRVKYLGFSEDRDEIYIAHNLDSDKFRGYSLNLKTGMVEKEVFRDPYYDFAPGIYHGGVRTDSNNRLMGFSYLSNEFENHWLDPELGKLKVKINKDYPEGESFIYGFTDDVETILFRHNDGRSSKDYVYSRKTAKYTLFADWAERLFKYHLPQRNKVTYTASDGSVHDAYLTLPAGGGKHPALVIPYDSIRGRFKLGFSKPSVFFASRGFAVLEVNYRGVKGYGMEYFISGIQNNLEVLVRDIADSARWLKSRSNIDNDRVFVFGQHLGGVYALLASARNPGVFHGAVIESSPIDMLAEVKDYKIYRMKEHLDHIKLVANGRLKKKSLKSISPADMFSELNHPMLFMYGENTTYMTEKRFDKLVKKHKKKDENIEIKFIRKEGDSVRKNTNKSFVAESAYEFLRGI